jgi:hypothetical protein
MPRGILVLGYHRDDGTSGISPLALAGVRRAEGLARAADTAVVVCSGYARGDGEPEGELMRRAWEGPEIEVVAESEARDTVENAVLSLAALRARAVDELDIVCAASHAPRVRLLLVPFFARHEIRARVRAFWRPFPLRRLWWEMRALAFVPAFRRRLTHGDPESSR